MNYQQALDYLYSFLDTEAKLPRRPAEFNLPRTTALLEAVGHPERAFRSVVVAGTKGKGSTAVMLEAILRAAGYRTGLWTSPHLHSYRERIQIDRVPISREQLAAEVERVVPVIERFDIERYGSPSVFDLGFTLALRYFAEQRVDIAVLEVGLGGRYDSANAVTPILSIITSISYDHMQTLGDTLAKIANEKAGIAKPGVPLLTTTQQPEAAEVIAQVAGEVGAPLFVASGDEAQSESAAAKPALRGDFQRENARLAVHAALLLREQGLVIPDEATVTGLARAVWPGRMEVVPGRPVFVLDGAHNGDSARHLVASIGELFPGRRIVLVFGTTRDKDVARMFAELMPAVEALVLTHSRHPRAEVSLESLAERARPYFEHREIPVPVELTGDIPEALDQARRLAGAEDIVCVTGSLFVVAAAREALGLPHERD